jgi:Asp-tRNA(Asn)/Glu-tRNA(Gln) amidotransferase B subunit
LVFNRVIGLKNTWASKTSERKSEQRGAAGPAKEKATPAASRKGRVEARTQLRARTPALAERFERYQKKLSLPAELADLLSSDLELATFFDQAAAAHPRAESVAKWLLNDLLGLVKDRSLRSLPFTAADFGHLVALVDGGRITQAAGKTLLTTMVERGGDPKELVRELGLEKLDDRAAIEAAVARVLQSQSAEVARYRAGERKLFGVLVGAAMRETQGVADAAAVRKVLSEKLG